MMPWLIIMSVLTAVISVVELFFFSFTGSLVDWLGAGDRAGFLTAHAWALGGMAATRASREAWSATANAREPWANGHSAGVNLAPKRGPASRLRVRVRRRVCPARPYWRA